MPVTSSNEEADDGGTGPPAEKGERKRIYLDFYRKKLPLGDVHVYIVGPDGASINGLDINSANDSQKMTAFLTQVAAQLHTEPGPPAVKPHAQSIAPASGADSMTLHLVSRSLAGGSWHEFPAENWIVLSRAEWGQLLPSGAVTPNVSWEVPRPVALKLAEWVYPQNEEKTQVNRSRVDVAAFRMTVTALEGGLARARIDGKVRLEAQLLSWRAKRRLCRFRTSWLHGFRRGAAQHTAPADGDDQGDLRGDRFPRVRGFDVPGDAGRAG